MNYTEKSFKKQELKPTKKIIWMNFRILNTDTSYFLEQDLPTPTLIQHFPDSYNLHYAIQGYMGTQKIREYIKDTQEKIALLLGPLCNILRYDPKYINEYSHFQNHLYQLKQFNHIRDLRVSDTINRRRYNAKLLTKDEMFEYGRYKCYDLKLKDNLSYEACFDIFYSININMSMNKDIADVRAKAKAVYNWTEEHYNPKCLSDDEIKANRRAYDKKYYAKKTNKKEDEIMTRQEIAKKNAIRNAEVAKRKVLNLVCGMFKDEYKKKNGKWHISRIAKDSGTSVNTVKKYLPKETLF